MRKPSNIIWCIAIAVAAYSAVSAGMSRDWIWMGIDIGIVVFDLVILFLANWWLGE